MTDFEQAAAGEQSSPTEYFRPVWRRRWLILIMAVVATVATYVYYNHKPRVYAASTSLYVGNGSYIQSLLGQGASNNDPTRTLTDLATLVKSPPVIAAAAKLIGNRAELGPVDAVPETNSDFIQLSSSGPSPVLAAATVNAYARAFVQFRTQTLRQEAAVGISQVQHQLSLTNPNSPQTQSLEQELATLKTQESDPTGSIQQIAQAVPNPTPLSPNPKKDAIFALTLSLMLGIALAYGLDRLDRRIRSEEELQPLYQLPVLGEIPQVLLPTPNREGAAYVDHEQWESFRALRTNLELVMARQPLRTIMVVSAQPSEGKSLVVRNLALAYADAGSRVAIIEADLRAPTLAKTLAVEPEPGLSEVLAEVELLPEAIQSVPLEANDAGGRVTNGKPRRAQAEVSDGSQRWHASRTGVAVKSEPVVGTLDVLTSGAKPEHFSASLAAEGIKAVLARMTELYDVVLVDSAPLLAVSDSVPLVSEVDGVVVVARIGTTSQHAARRVVELLGRVPGARLLGVVANSLTKTSFHYGAGYGPSYGS